MLTIIEDSGGETQILKYLIFWLKPINKKNGDFSLYDILYNDMQYVNANTLLDSSWNNNINFSKVPVNLSFQLGVIDNLNQV